MSGCVRGTAAEAAFFARCACADARQIPNPNNLLAMELDEWSRCECGGSGERRFATLANMCCAAYTPKLVNIV